MLAERKILVVDDDPVVGKSFNRVLSNKGYAVITVSSGEEAIDKLKSERYDAVFTDIKMPGMSGLDVAEKVKASQPWLPVVIITGYGSPDNEARAVKAGVVDFMRKPLSPEMIEMGAEKAISYSQVEDAVEQVEQPILVAEETKRNIFKDIALFVLAPFIGLAYILAFPAIGLGLMTITLYKGSAKFKRVANIILAPIVTIGFVVFGPIIGLGMITYFGTKAWFRLLT